MARCRIEYVLGNLVDNFSEDPPESRVARVKKDFLEYGLDLPQLQASDVGSAQAFLRCLALWRGKSPKENAAAKHTKEIRTNGVEERATAHRGCWPTRRSVRSTQRPRRFRCGPR
ncbi:unnamed protein product [Oikopleura dioica]|uniref:Uncharacterized protein n=1 Tax=Oikopleura dioica TaxID=34765 RepID=E4Y1R6_OIKDI|nr:unnamed protein product [Oikopleura dioica]